jgi:FkbM family methyltransferase
VTVIRTVDLAGRRLLTAAVRRLPPAAVVPLRRVPVLRGVLRRGGLPASVRTFTLPGNPALRFTAADSLVAAQLYWFGERGWEPELLPWWRFLCRRADAILELGSNIGYFAVQGGRAAPWARYVAVEPHPVSARLCRANLALNGVCSVEVITAAASANPGVAGTPLVVPWEQLGAPTVAFVAADSELPASMARQGTVTTVSTVDVRPLLAGVDLVKLDVEGQEHTLLAAGWRQLADSRPTVVVEVLAGTPRLRAVLVRLCTELGYRAYVPHARGLGSLPVRRLPAVSLQHEFGVNDLVLCARYELGQCS